MNQTRRRTQRGGKPDEEEGEPDESEDRVQKQTRVDRRKIG